MSKTIPATSIAPAPIGSLGLPAHREPTIDGNELVSAYLARNGIKSVKGRIFGICRLPELLTLAVGE